MEKDDKEVNLFSNSALKAKIDKQKCQQMTEYLNKTMQERKKLAEKLREVEMKKAIKEQEYK